MNWISLFPAVLLSVWGTTDAPFTGAAETVPLSESGAHIYRQGQTQRPQGPLRLAPGPRLFIDDYYFETAEGVSRVVDMQERDAWIPNPIVTGKEVGCFQPYMTVLRDEQTGRFGCDVRPEFAAPLDVLVKAGCCGRTRSGLCAAAENAVNQHRQNDQRDNNVFPVFLGGKRAHRNDDAGHRRGDQHQQPQLNDPAAADGSGAPDDAGNAAEIGGFSAEYCVNKWFGAVPEQVHNASD